MSNDSIAKTFLAGGRSVEGQVILQAADVPYYKPFRLPG